MGNYTSKLFSHHNEHDSDSKSNQSSPGSIQKIRMCTPPVTKRKLVTDPRSATMGIVRTPIEVTCTTPGLNSRVPSALPKYLQGKCYLETDIDAVMSAATPEKCIPDPRSPNICQQRTPIMVKSIDNYVSPVVTVREKPEMETPVGVRTSLSVLDPRSPAIDFDRTPILKPRSTEHTGTKISKDSTVDRTENKSGHSILSYCETTTDYNIPEIQSISDPVLGSNESLSLENRLKVGETLKDSASNPGSSEEMSDCSENEEQITVIRNPNILSSHPDPSSTWTEDEALETVNRVAEKGEHCEEPLGKALDNSISTIINAVIKNTIDEPKSSANTDKIKVWRDSISPSIDDEPKSVVHKTTAEEIIIEFDDETVTKTSKPVNAVAKLISKTDDDKSKNQMKKKKPQQIINGENKPMIEERKIFNEAKNTVEPSLNRTPLGNRSNNHKQRSRIPAKSPQQLFRNKGFSAISIQQENTPPTERFTSKTKPNAIQWDPDATVLI